MEEPVIGNRPEPSAEVPWNVVITIYEEKYRTARAILRDFGAAMPTRYHNVLVMQVADPRQFLERLSQRIAAEPGILNSLSRVLCASESFVFRDPAEFEARARDSLGRLAPALAGKGFHIRMHRRGLKGRLSSREEEQRLGKMMLDILEEAGTPGKANFDDPDVIVAVETVDECAGLSVWTREDLRRYPFLRLD